MSGGNGGGYKAGGNYGNTGVVPPQYAGGPKYFAGGAPGNFNMQPNPTGGVGTSAFPTGGLQPSMTMPAQTAANGPKLPPLPPGMDPGIWSQLYGNTPPPPVGSPEWFSSPQGMAQQWKAGVSNSPLAGFMPNGGQYPGGPRHGNGGPSGPSASVTSIGALRGTDSPVYDAAMQAQQANWQNPDWRLQQVIAQKIAPTNWAEQQALINSLPPDQKAAYLAKYNSVGLNPMQAPGGGTPSNPFGS